MIEVLKEVSEVSLLDLNNLLIEYPLFLGLKMLDSKVYGIVAYID